MFGSLASVCWASDTERVGFCIAHVPHGKMKHDRLCIASLIYARWRAFVCAPFASRRPRLNERPSFMHGSLPLQLHGARSVLSSPPPPQTHGTCSNINRSPFTKQWGNAPDSAAFAAALAARGVVCVRSMYINLCRRSSAIQRCL